MVANSRIYLESLAEQHPPGTPLESIPVPDPDVGLRIMIDSLGVRPGKEIRGMGYGRIRDVRSSSSSSSSSQPSAVVAGLSAQVKKLQEDLRAERAEKEALYAALTKAIPGFVPPPSSHQPPSDMNDDDATSLE